MISFGRRIRKATENVRIKELYVHIPRDLCNKALTILTHFSTARAPETTPGSVPIQTRLALEAHKALYQLSLIWTDYDEDDLTYPHSPTTVIRFALFANLIASFPSPIVTPFPFSCKIIRFRFLVLGLYDFRLFGFDISLFCDLAC